MDESIPMEVFESPEELRDLEELQFSKQVISDIARRRKKHENKLAWPSLANYIEYIATERRLLALVVCKDRVPEKKKVMEGRLIKKINRLYKEARCKLGDDYELLTDYLQFLKNVKAKTRAKEISELLMEKYPEKPEVFLTAITWYIQTHNPASLISQTIDKALTHHPSSKEIFVEAFLFELGILDDYITHQGQLTEERLEKLKFYIDLFFQNTEKNIDQYFEVLDKFAKFQQKTGAKDYLQQKIMDVCKEEPAFWENLVKREGSSTALAAQQKLNQCIATYEKGLTIVPEDRKTDLWELYLKFLLDTCSCVEFDQNSMRVEVNFVSEKFEQAHVEKFLTEDMYFFWLELDKRIRCQDALREVNGVISAKVNPLNFEIFEKALQTYPQSIKLWKAYLTTNINHDKTSDEIATIFERAIAAVPENASQLWLIFVTNREQVEEDEYIETLYSRAMKDPQVAVALARKYLSWTYLIHGIEECRKIYDSLVEANLQCKEIHPAMLKFEFLEFDGSYTRWEMVYENSLRMFPHDVDMWVDYMKFHAKYKMSGEETVNALIKRALSSLPDSSQLLLRQRMFAEDP